MHYSTFRYGLARGDELVIGQIVAQELTGENHTFVEYKITKRWFALELLNHW